MLFQFSSLDDISNMWFKPKNSREIDSQIHRQLSFIILVKFFVQTANFSILILFQN